MLRRILAGGSERIRHHVLTRLSRYMVQREQRDDLVRLGSRYGGWTVPSRLLPPGSICYCAGVGEDATFDLALVETFGCTVFAFDPTPRAIDYARAVARGQQRFIFLPVGVWGADEVVRFYGPTNPEHVSHSAVNLQRTSVYFEAECRSVSSLMGELGHDRIDLLKLDVEGAEYVVLSSLATDEVRPRVLCVEFDQPSPYRVTLDALRRLERNGYDVVSIEGWNFTLVDRTA